MKARFARFLNFLYCFRFTLTAFFVVLSFNLFFVFVSVPWWTFPVWNGYVLFLFARPFFITPRCPHCGLRHFPPRSLQ